MLTWAFEGTSVVRSARTASSARWESTFGGSRNDSTTVVKGRRTLPAMSGVGIPPMPMIDSVGYHLRRRIRSSALDPYLNAVGHREFARDDLSELLSNVVGGLEVCGWNRGLHLGNEYLTGRGSSTGRVVRATREKKRARRHSLIHCAGPGRGPGWSSSRFSTPRSDVVTHSRS